MTIAVVYKDPDADGVCSREVAKVQDYTIDVEQGFLRVVYEDYTLNMVFYKLDNISRINVYDIPEESKGGNNE